MNESKHTVHLLNRLRGGENYSFLSSSSTMVPHSLHTIIIMYKMEVVLYVRQKKETDAERHRQIPPQPISFDLHAARS